MLNDLLVLIGLGLFEVFFLLIELVLFIIVEFIRCVIDVKGLVLVLLLLLYEVNNIRMVIFVIIVFILIISNVLIFLYVNWFLKFFYILVGIWDLYYYIILI